LLQAASADITWISSDLNLSLPYDTMSTLFLLKRSEMRFSHKTSLGLFTIPKQILVETQYISSLSQYSLAGPAARRSRGAGGAKRAPGCAPRALFL